MLYALGSIVIQHPIICRNSSVDGDGVESAPGAWVDDAERLRLFEFVHVDMMECFLGKRWCTRSDLHRLPFIYEMRASTTSASGACKVIV